MTFDPVLIRLKNDLGCFLSSSTQKSLTVKLHVAVMRLHTLSVRALLFLGLWQTGRRSLASAPELKEQPKKIGTSVLVSHRHHLLT